MSIILLLLASVASASLRHPFEVKNTKWLMPEPEVSISQEGNRLKDVSMILKSKCGENQFSGIRSLKKRIDVNEQTKREILANPCVIGVGPSGKLTLHDADPMMKDQRHLESVGAVELAQDLLSGYLKSKVVLAVIDTGLEMKHPEFSELWINQAEAKGATGVDDDGNGYVDDIHGYNFVDKTGDTSHKTSNDHGSHVAGLAAAGLANGVGGAGLMGKNLELMILNVVGSHWDEVDLTDTENAVRYAADKGADVINISIGGVGEFPTLAAAITYAINKGVTVVVSAGNGGVNIDETFISPASYAKDMPGLISVGALDVSGSQMCQFSNYGKSVKLMAPGCDSIAPKSGLLSTLRNASFGYKKGTSMAAPLASAAVALIYSYWKDQRKTPSPAEAERILTRYSQQGLDLRELRKEIRKGSTL